MAAQTLHDEGYVVICGLSPAAYERVLEAIGDCHPRHTYDRGALELRRVLHGVAPEQYGKLLDALSEHYLRHTYDGWTLEMMTPRKDHEWIRALLGRMIEAVAFALEIPIQSVGSTTLSAGSHQRGLQPDGAYYVGRESEVRGSDQYRPGEDPPPDLAVEVDVTSTSIPRLPVYAQIGVPEIWCYEGGKVRFYSLAAGGEYSEVHRSGAFPFLAPEDITRLLDLRHKTDENSVIRAIVDWAQDASSR